MPEGVLADVVGVAGLELVPEDGAFMGVVARLHLDVGYSFELKLSANKLGYRFSLARAANTAEFMRKLL